MEEICVKTEPLCSEACVKNEPSCTEECAKEEYSYMDVCVKQEPPCSNVCVKDEPSCSNVCLNSELHEPSQIESAHGVSEAAAAARLYADHVVKEELVLGPELVQSCPRLVLVSSQGTFIECSFPRMHVYEIWHSIQGRFTKKKDHVLKVLMTSFQGVENIKFDALEKRVSYLCTQLNAYWKNVSRSKSKLMSKYSDWLNMVEFIKLPRTVSEGQGTQLIEVNLGQSHSLDRRPRKKLAELSKRLQQRRIAELAQVDNSAVNALLDTRASSSKTDIGSKINISADEVLSVFVEANLSKHQYMLIRNFINNKTECNIMPSYQDVLKAKVKCYPTNISVSETTAEVELQNLLDHTVLRIVESQKDILHRIDSSDSITLIGKWGFDGSTGHSEYKQCFENASSESSLFVTSYIPLQLVANLDTEGSRIIWKNPRPASTRYCRPIRFQFLKETNQVSKDEEEYFKEKFRNLIPTSFNFQDCVFKVAHLLKLTMVDGKVCTALMDSSNMKCYICGAVPSEMNKLGKCIKKPTMEEGYEYGLSPLQAYIRFFEYFIHLAYKMDSKKWKLQTKAEKELMEKRKLHIQSEFKKQLGLNVDKPRSGGSGASNDGNTARRFFKYSAKSAEITGLDKNLIDRCGHILEAMSSGFNIDSDKFKKYAFETATMLIDMYGWYYLPASVHKVLIHGAEVVEKALVSIGELSEEAAEVNNKHLKAFRRLHTRKLSRELNNTDLINRLLLCSDPYITGLRKLPRKKKKLLPSQTLELLRI